MESEEDGVITPRSTAASTPVSTPMSPNQYLADTLQQVGDLDTYTLCADRSLIYYLE